MNNDKKFEHEIDPDLLAEIEEWEKADHDEPAEYYFSNPDPYLKPQPLPPDHSRHNCYFNEDGHLCVKNLSAFWLPEFTLQKEIGGTIYSLSLIHILFSLLNTVVVTDQKTVPDDTGKLRISKTVSGENLLNEDYTHNFTFEVSLKDAGGRALAGKYYYLSLIHI